MTTVYTLAYLRTPIADENKTDKEKKERLLTVFYLFNIIQLMCYFFLDFRDALRLICE